MLKLDGEITIKNSYDGEMGIFKKQAGTPYTGSYEITPKVIAQSLETAEKYMQKDLTVKAIPYYDVSNPSGGNTIYIGNEVN